MSWLVILGFGFVMNFIVGFGIRGFFFADLPPFLRALYTALVSFAVCVGAAAFGGYFLIGVSMAVFALLTVALLYLIPAFLHFLMLYYQFNMAWAVTDTEVAEAEAIEQAIMSRKIATVRSKSGDTVIPE